VSLPTLLIPCWREIQCKSAHDELETTILNGGLDPITRLFHSRIRKTDDDYLRLTPARIDLDFYRVSINPENGGRTDFGKHD